MDQICYKCETDINEDSDFGECDSCNNLFHIKCVGARKTDVSARANSKHLLLLCNHCRAIKSIQPECIKIILRFIQKIDLNEQEKIEKQIESDNLVKTLTTKIIELENKVESINQKNNVTIKSTSTIGVSGSTSYANVTRSGIKPAVVIKPKGKQQCNKTVRDITSNLNASELNLRQTKYS